MRAFQADGRTVSGYLAVPEHGSGPGVVVLHAWWGLTQLFRQVCDRLAEAGFVALAPDLYHGKTTASVEEAEALVEALDQDVERVRGDIAAAVQVLRQHTATKLADGRGKLALVGFSMGGCNGYLDHPFKNKHLETDKRHVRSQQPPGQKWATDLA